jgi:hypothetical protein
VANPTAAVPDPTLDPIFSLCGYVFLVVGGDADPPVALPADNPQAYWNGLGLGSPAYQQWQTFPRTSQACQPTASGSP